MPSNTQVTNVTNAFAAAHDNADYSVTGDVAKAKLYVVAVRRLLFLADQSERTGESVRFDKRHWADELKKAEQWVAVHDTTSARGGIRYFKTGGIL